MNIFEYCDDIISTFNIIGYRNNNNTWAIPSSVEFLVALEYINSELIKISAIINVVNQSLDGHGVTCSVYNDHVCFTQKGDGIHSIFDFYYATFDVYDNKLYRFRSLTDKKEFSRVKKINNILKKMKSYD